MIPNDSENGLTKNQNLQDLSKSKNWRMLHSDFQSNDAKETTLRLNGMGTILKILD